MKTLIAEDDMVSRRVLQVPLEKWGHEVIIAQDGVETLAAFRHHEGSKALCRIAEIFKQSFRESDIIACIGGDEFAILATDAPFSNIPIPLDRLRENLSSYNSQKLHPYQLALSLGLVCINPDDNSSIDELLA